MSSTWTGGWCELHFGSLHATEHLSDRRRPVLLEEPAFDVCPVRSVNAWHGGGDLPEEPLCPGPSLTARCRGVDAHDRVDPDGTRPASFVPWAGPDVRPLTARSGMLDCVVVVVLAGQNAGRR